MSEKKTDKLMEIMGADAIIDSLFDRILVKETALSIPEKVLVKTVFNNCKPRFIKDLGQVYDENFTESEIDQILAFYSSDVGQKMLDKMLVLQEAGQRIGERVFSDSLFELTGESV